MADKIRFRELILEDTIKLYNIYAAKEAMKYRGSKPMKNIEDARKFVKNQRKLEGDVLTVRKGVEILSRKELIGSSMFRINVNKKDECEIGYSIGREFWGQNLGNEIVNLMLRKIEESSLIRRIIAWSNINNIASIKILKNNGFCQIEEERNQDICLYVKMKK